MTPTTAAPARGRFIVPGFLLLAAVWGASFLFIKIIIGEMHPVYLTLGRVILGTVTLLVAMLIVRDRFPRSLRLWWHLTVASVVGLVIPYVLVGYGELHIPSLLAGIWNATTPLVALPTAALLFRTEQLSLRRSLGVGLGFVGVLVLLGVWQGIGGASFTAQLMCFAASALYGIIIPYTKRYISHEPVSSLAAIAAQMVIATVVLLPVAPLIAGAPPSATSLSPDVLLSLLVLGVISTGLAFLIHYRNIRVMGASTASQVTYLIPVFAVVVGVAVLSEPLTWFQPVGAAVVLLGVAISNGVSLPRWRRPLPRWRAGRLATGDPPPTPVVDPPATR